MSWTLQRRSIYLVSSRPDPRWTVGSLNIVHNHRHSRRTVLRPDQWRAWSCKTCFARIVRAPSFAVRKSSDLKARQCHMPPIFLCSLCTIDLHRDDAIRTLRFLHHHYWRISSSYSCADLDHRWCQPSRVKSVDSFFSKMIASLFIAGYFAVFVSDAPCITGLLRWLNVVMAFATVRAEIRVLLESFTGKNAFTRRGDGRCFDGQFIWTSQIRKSIRFF